MSESNALPYSEANVEYGVIGRRKGVDFMDISPADCLTLLKQGNKQTAILWQPIHHLDVLLAKSKELELKANGIDQTIIPQKYSLTITSSKVDEVDSFMTASTLTASAILNQYSLWLKKREQFITGRPGSFLDLGNLSVVVADICILKDITTYFELYNLLDNLLFFWTVEHDTCEEFLREERKVLGKLPKPENAEDDFTNSKKQMAFMNLLRSPNFKVTDLALVYYKLRGVVMIEREIEKLKEDYLGL